MARTKDPYDINFYEGLVHSTAAMYAPKLELEFDDICQILRVKIWRALELFDADRSRMKVERYVFMCVKNKTKDLLELRRRGEVYIEDQRTRDANMLDAFEARYLATDHEQTFGSVDEGTPLVPSTLGPVERRVVVLLYRDFTQTEIARTLDLRRSEMERTMRTIREKMADWKPGVGAEQRIAA